MGCINHPNANTIEVEPPVARYQCEAEHGKKGLPGCEVVLVKPANEPPPADCPHCKKPRAKAELLGVQYYCGEAGCGVQVI